MKTREVRRLDRASLRALDHRGAKSDRSPAVVAKSAYVEGTLCETCGSVYSRKTWRRSSERPATALARNATRRNCPACIQVGEGRSFGRVVIRGGVWLTDHESEVRQRIANVEARARHTQPERRVVEIGRLKGGLEIMSTSQKLAHRVVRELEKAFGGISSYHWSDSDGSLTATWTHG